MNVCEFTGTQFFPAQFWAFLIVWSFGGRGAALSWHSVWRPSGATFRGGRSVLVTADCHVLWQAQYLVMLEGV